MRYLIILILSCSAFALKLEVDYAMQNGEKFSIISLKHTESFACKEKIDINGNNILIDCEFDKKPTNELITKSLDFFNINYKVTKNKFHILIIPKYKQSLFSNFTSLKQDLPIPLERPTKSKNWQIVGYNDKIPFLSNKTFKENINFPITIPDTFSPHFGELNIDTTPLSYDEGLDFSLFLNIRSLYEKKDYVEGARTADNFIQTYPDSIFMRDVLYYKILILYNQKEYSSAIDLAKLWIDRFPADINAQEILYIIGDCYAKQKIYGDSNYYFNRLVDEYDGSKYAQYAIVGLADNLWANGDKKQPPLLFAKAYEGSKDIDTASFVAMEWARYLMENDKKPQAKELYNKVIVSNPMYFTKNPNDDFKTLQNIAYYEMYDIAARAGEILYNYLNNMKIDTPLKEQLLNNIGQWYELASNPDDAHRNNLEFLENFKDSSNFDSVKLRDDNLIFSIKEDSNYEEQIKKYDHIISTYPNTSNATTALNKKANLMFKYGDYNGVIALKNSLDKDSEVVKKSYIKLIETHKLCKSILEYYLGYRGVLVTSNAKLVFECLYNARLYKNAADLSLAMIKDSPNKLEWLYNNANANFKLGDYNKSALAAREAFEIAKGATKIENNIKSDSLIVLFLSLSNLGRKQEALSVFDTLKREVKLQDVGVIEVYYKMLEWAINDNDNIAIIKYAKEAISLQKKFKSYNHSPFIELSLANALFSEHKYSEMLESIQNIFTYHLDNNEKQRVYYISGVALNELGRKLEAKNNFEQCISISKDSEFGEICAEALLLNK